jgi:hypothetical protein
MGGHITGPTVLKTSFAHLRILNLIVYGETLPE